MDFVGQDLDHVEFRSVVRQVADVFVVLERVGDEQR